MAAELENICATLDSKKIDSMAKRIDALIEKDKYGHELLQATEILRQMQKYSGVTGKDCTETIKEYWNHISEKMIGAFEKTLCSRLEETVRQGVPLADMYLGSAAGLNLEPSISKEEAKMYRARAEHLLKELEYYDDGSRSF